MPKVFISYRRDDSAYATHAIYKHLADRYGADSGVFDVDSIPLGVDFVEYLSEQVSQCDALLAIIGSGWVDARSEDGTRRLDDPDDFVQIEIHSALKLGISVIPVLVDRTSMPRADELPPSLKLLSRRNAAEVRPGRDFQSHLELLVRGLDRVFKHASQTKGKTSPPPPSTDHRSGTPQSEKGSRDDPSVRQRPKSKQGDASPKSIPQDKADRIQVQCPNGHRLTASESSRGKRANCPTCSTPFVVPKSGEKAKHITANESAAVAPPLEVITNSIGIKLKLIPAGEFMMGETSAKRKVRITKPFYLGVHTITQEQYATVMGLRPWQGEPTAQDGPDYPATFVSWDDAVEFCHKLSKQEGLEYCLPTEAQWEYACRAGTTTTYSFGDDVAELGDHAWYRNNAWDVGEKYAHRVGQKLPNPWGLYDMHGNIREWCSDRYGEYEGAEQVTDPNGPATGEFRVLRGGSFSFVAVYCRSAFRVRYVPVFRGNLGGFRVSRTYS